MKKQIVIFVTLFFIQVGIAQSNSKQDVIDAMSGHVHFLADDRLEGRATGSLGEKMAQSYIVDQFAKAGIQALGTKGYLQTFSFSLGKSLTQTNTLAIDKVNLPINETYFPLVYSANANISAPIINVGFGIDAGEIYNDYASLKNTQGKVFAIHYSSPDGVHPHSKYKDFSDYKTKITTAIKYGAVAVIFYNDDPNLDDPKNDLQRNVQSESIPVVFLTKAYIPLLKDDAVIDLYVSLQKNERKGDNIVAFIDNKSANTVVIGAHYDHLGWGKDGGSLHRGEPAIHNGADDNASGVAVLLELAKSLKNSSVAKANNYLFICFSAEELGLIGSKSFLDAKLFNEQNINYMINLDMVGRLDEKTKQLAVGGVGTASVFNTLTKEITAGELTIMTSESGMGPSDHASFYLKNIPVLFLFTGTHYDYHKPSDDAYKLNYTGMFNIKEYIEELIVKLDSQGKLTFIKTKEEENASAKRKFNVTMGVVPSYMYDGVGLKIDGVTEEKPAAKAGVHAGDILVKMATLEITDMMAYMNALSKFNKGDQIVIEVIRNGQKIPLNLTF